MMRSLSSESGSSGSSYGPTKTHRRSYEIAREEYEQVIGKLKSLTERDFVGPQFRDPGDRIVVKGADDGGAEAEGGRLQVDVLGRVTDLDMHVADAPPAVLHGGSFRHSGDHHNRRRIRDPALRQRRPGDRRTPVAGRAGVQRMGARIVPVDAGR